MNHRTGNALRLTIAALLISACSVDNVLKVPDPDVARPGDVIKAAGLPTVLAGAVGDFQVAFAGTGGGTGIEGLVNMTGLLADEFTFTETFPTRVQVDRRAIDRNNSTMLTIYFVAQRARQSAFRAESAYAVLAPTDTLYAEALSLEGYSFILLAESYCSGVPITKLDAAGNIVPGQPLTTQQLADSAIDRFSRARAVLGTRSPFLNSLTRVGQARATLFRTNSSLSANLTAAAALVAPVPDDFEYTVFSSSNTDRQNNGVFELQWLEGRWSQSEKEGTNGMRFRTGTDTLANGQPRVAGGGDPRTPFVDFGPRSAFDGQRNLVVSLKYPSRDASTVLASGTEARLIQAEAALAAGNYAGAGGTLEILNNLRSAIGMAPLTPAATATTQLNQLFAERAFWLYLTAHRLGDLRRLSRSAASGGYGRNTESVFPTGTYTGRGGGVFGPDVNFPIPIEEANANPNAPACLDRNP
jgi:SusD/RagB-like outer membrane lipoprotein